MDDEDKEVAAVGEVKRGVNNTDDDEEDDDGNSIKTVKQEEDYMPYPIRYCMYAIPLDIQQLQQQQ